MARAVIVLACCAFFGACGPPPLDGGWTGTATCGQSAFPIDAIFNEVQPKTLEGTIFIEGIFGGLIAKGTIDNGERNDDGSYIGDLNTDDDAAAEFTFDFAYLANSPDDAKGTVDQLDNSGKTQSTCALHMTRETLSTD